MKKEDFIKLGLDETTAIKVAVASQEELKAYVLKSQYEEAVEAKKTLGEQIKERDKQLETLKKNNGDAEALKAEITKLQEANKAAKTEYEAKIQQIQVDNAVEKALMNAKAKNTKAVRALLDLEKAEIEGGEIKGLREQLKKLQEADDSKFLFEPQDGQAPKIFGMSPAEGINNRDDQNLSPGAQFAAMYNSQFVAPEQN